MFRTSIFRDASISALYAVCAVFITSCQSPKPLSEKQFRTAATPLDTAEVRTITLSKEGTAITFPSGFLGLNDHFLLMDPLSSMRCFVFNRNGSLRFELGRTGQGPGEFQLPMSFTESEGRFYLVSGGDRRINVYDQNGIFIKSADRDFTCVVYSLQPYPGGAIGSTVSRYCDFTIFVLNQEGALVRSFAPPPEEIRYTFENQWPAGGILVEKDRILQYYNFEYKLHSLSHDGVEGMSIQLASSYYKAPDLAIAKTLADHKARVKFQSTYTPVSGLYAFTGGYITRLSAFQENGDQKDHLEFWDRDFNSLGWLKVDDGVFIGVQEDLLAFLRFGEKTNTIAFKRFTIANPRINPII